MTRQLWSPEAPGVFTLPSGRRVRGRGLRYGAPGRPVPSFGVYLTGRRPPEMPWESEWIVWRDFWVPADPPDAVRKLRLLLERAAGSRVEACCGGGVGRTGTALSVLCILEGLEPEEAVARVRARYHRRAVETPWQRRFIRQVHRDRLS